MVNAPETKQVRYVSTGRGGAANFKKATNMAKTQAIQARENPALVTPVDDDCELTRVATKASLGARFAIGRGGKGNFLPVGEVPLPPQTAPLPRRPSASVMVGRGGAGNKRDVKTGRSASSSSASATRPKKDDLLGKASGVAQLDRPTWAARVPRIDASLRDADNDNAIDDEGSVDGGRRPSFTSTKSAPAQSSFFGKMRRRLSSFGTALE